MEDVLFHPKHHTTKQIAIVYDRRKIKEKTNLRVKRHKGMLHRRCIESNVKTHRILFKEICPYFKDTFLPSLPKMTICESSVYR